MDVGTAWYPEHWPEERWKLDMELMAAAGMTVVRVAEFAWSSMEKEEGVIELDWLQRAVDLASEYGLKTVMCTPTPTPPAWLIRKHPEILPKRTPGSEAVQLHGERGHYDPANVDFRRHCRRIVTALAQQFGKDPKVLGWQTDNEFWTISTNEASMKAFRDWLQAKYGSLDVLNERWSTAFWSQTYFAWEDVQPPLKYPNPALYLDWHRFHSHLIADFQREHIEILRQECSPEQWITHNFHPFDDLDRDVISEDLDLVSWDAYILGDQLKLDVAGNALDAETLWSIKRRNIWIMETLPGFVNWRPVNRHSDPGETRTMAWSQIGHGADAVLYWQWRSAPSCQEQYHGNLIQQDGEPRPVYDEVAQLGNELKQVSPFLDGTQPRSEIAVVNRWCDRQVLKKQPHHKDYIAKDRIADVYRACQTAGFSPQALSRIEGPFPWKMIIAPNLHVLSDEDAERLLAFVDQGGHLVLGPRSGMKDEWNRLRESRQPGPFAKRLGATVREFYALPEPVWVHWEGASPVGEARIFAEWMEADHAEVLARYAEGTPWLGGQAAVVSSAQPGGGRITYFGCCGDPDFHAELLGQLRELTPLTPLVPDPPSGLEVMQRVTETGESRLVLVNHNDHDVSVTLPEPHRDLLSGEQGASRELSFSAYGCKLLIPVG